MISAAGQTGGRRLWWVMEELIERSLELFPDSEEETRRKFQMRVCVLAWSRAGWSLSYRGQTSWFTRITGRLGGPPATDMPDEYDWHYWVEQVLEEVIQQVRRCFESEGATWIPLSVVTVGGVRWRLLQHNSQQFS